MEARIPEFLYPFLSEMERLEEVSELPWRTEDLKTGARILTRLFRNRIRGERIAIGGSEINVIPPIGHPGPCRAILLVAIGAMDNVERRILEAVEHVNVKCRGITKHVIFYAAKWDQTAWLRHSRSFTEVSTILKMPLTKPILLA